MIDIEEIVSQIAISWVFLLTVVAVTGMLFGAYLLIMKVRGEKNV